MTRLVRSPPLRVTLSWLNWSRQWIRSEWAGGQVGGAWDETKDEKTLKKKRRVHVHVVHLSWNFV